MHFFIKIVLSALIIAGVSEIGKRSSAFAAVLASLPLSSILAMIWLYADTGDVAKVSELSTSILWAVIPSFLFFISFPLLLKTGMRFVFAMPLACAIMFAGYTVYMLVLKKMGVA
ncbi:MAG: DUF3147 family protein [Methylotenera sp.]|nr:DUF3147 family protein [Oligoflexia bacterium]